MLSRGSRRLSSAGTPSALEQLSSVTVATPVPTVLDVRFDPGTMISTQCDVPAAKPPEKRYSTESVLS